MCDADLLISPSLYEGAPNAVMEAVYLGLPVLLSNIPAHQALFPNADSSCFFNPADPAELGAILTDILARPLRLRDIKVMQEDMNFLRPDEMAMAYKIFYARVLGGGPSASAH